MKNILLYFMGIIISLMVSPFFIQAQQIQRPVSFTVDDAPKRIGAGQVTKVTVKASIDGKWYLYSIANDPEAGPYPTKFSSANPAMTINGEVKESKPVVEMDPNFNTELGRHSKEAVFTIPVTFSKQTSISTMIDLEVLYQVCNDEVCLPPKTESIMHPITIVAEDE